MRTFTFSGNELTGNETLCCREPVKIINLCIFFKRYIFQITAVLIINNGYTCFCIPPVYLLHNSYFSYSFCKTFMTKYYIGVLSTVICSAIIPRSCLDVDTDPVHDETYTNILIHTRMRPGWILRPPPPCGGVFYFSTLFSITNKWHLYLRHPEYCSTHWITPCFVKFNHKIQRHSLIKKDSVLIKRTDHLTNWI